MLKIPEFANRLRLSDGSVKKMVARRQITIVKIGRSVRIPETELDRLIKAGTRPAREGRAGD